MRGGYGRMSKTCDESLKYGVSGHMTYSDVDRIRVAEKCNTTRNGTGQPAKDEESTRRPAETATMLTPEHATALCVSSEHFRGRRAAVG